MGGNGQGIISHLQMLPPLKLRPPQETLKITLDVGEFEKITKNSWQRYLAKILK